LNQPVTEDEERKIHPRSKAVKAIEASFDELHRLTGEVTAENAAEPSKSDDMLVVYQVPDSGSDQMEAVTVSVHELTKTVTRTERHDDRYDLDVNVSFSGLDVYEVTTVKRVLTQHLRSLVTAARQENSEERITQLLRAVAPPDPLADVELKVAESTADLRREFLEQVPVLTSAQVHQRAGFPGGNPSQTVHRWRKQGKIFAANHGGRDWYPAFQFGDDGRPLPIIEELLARLRRDPERTDWDNALWFAGDSGWLDGKSPIEVLQSEPELVKRAAEQEVLRDES
jgi:hypothetical protein